MYWITLYRTSSIYDHDSINVPRCIIWKGILHYTHNHFLINAVLNKQSLMTFEPGLFELEDIDFVACKAEIQNSEHYISLSSNVQFEEVQFSELYTTLFEFHFVPQDSVSNYTFKSELRVTLIDGNGDLIRQRNCEIRIPGTIEL